MELDVCGESAWEVRPGPPPHRLIEGDPLPAAVPACVLGPAVGPC